MKIVEYCLKTIIYAICNTHYGFLIEKMKMSSSPERGDATIRGLRYLSQSIFQKYLKGIKLYTCSGCIGHYAVTLHNNLMNVQQYNKMVFHTSICSNIIVICDQFILYK